MIQSRLDGCKFNNVDLAYLWWLIFILFLFLCGEMKGSTPVWYVKCKESLGRFISTVIGQRNTQHHGLVFLYFLCSEIKRSSLLSVMKWCSLSSVMKWFRFWWIQFRVINGALAVDYGCLTVINGIDCLVCASSNWKKHCLLFVVRYMSSHKMRSVVSSWV